MPYEQVTFERLHQMKNRIEERIYEKILPLEVTAWVTKEPVPFTESQSGMRLKLSPGNKWGDLWDCAWFHFKGTVPASASNKKVVLLIDVNGELCLFDREGTPVQGLTNVNSEFDFALGKPGKRVVDVSDCAVGGESIDLWGEAGCNDLFGNYRSGTLKEADIAICHEEIRQLYYDVEVLLELAEQLEEHSARRAKIVQALYEVSLLLVEWDSLTIRQARSLLAKCLHKQNGDADLTISAIGHGHIDLAWLWPIRETIRKGARTFSTVLYNMEKYPDYVFGASQPQLYQWMKDYYPKLYERIKQRVAEGRWEVQGAMWVEPDSNIPGGEALIRQIIYGKRFFQEEFGKDVKVLWVPDIFGYTASLPQILKKSGVDYVMTQKLSWNVYNDHPHHTFYWEGIDGSRVLTHLPPEDTYNSPASPKSIVKAERDYYDKNVSDHCLMLFGIGDGGGGPGEEHLERLKRERNLLGLAPVVQEPAINFFEKLERDRDKYKTWRGELYLEKHQGTFTSQARNKKYNRQIEKALRELEFAAALSTVYTGETYPSEELEAIWKEMLLYQFHDILPGSSIKRVYDESLERYAALLERVEELTRFYYKALASTGKEQGIFIFNSLPWERTEWLTHERHWYQVSVPAMGYTVLNPNNHHPLNETADLTAEQNKLENDLLRIEFDEDGTIRSIYDKTFDRECISGNARANDLAIYHDFGDAWDFPTDYRSTKSMRPTLLNTHYFMEGPYAVANHEYRFGQSIIRQKVTLALGSRRIDFRTEVDWRETEKMLRTSFPLNVHTDHVNCEIQFGHLKRATHRNTSWDFARDEICAHQWIDLSEPDYGIALLNDSKYGHRAEGNTVDLNLLRSPLSPDPQADRAEHQFVYSVYPHGGDFVEAEVYKRGYELNVPLRRLESKEGPAKSQTTARSFIHMVGKGVMVETVKLAEDGKGLIVRLYETAGTHTGIDLSFAFDFESVFETDLLEQEMSPIQEKGSAIHVDFDPFEIKTLKIIPEK